MLINSFVYANFNYCPPTKSLRKIQKIQKGALKILYHDFDSDNESLLEQSGKCAIKVRRLQILGI